MFRISRLLRFPRASCAAFALTAIAATAVSAADPGSVQPTPEESRALCLGAPRSDSPIARSLHAAQERARSLSDKPEEWVRVGWSWVREARVASDAGLYLNVDACAAEALRIAPEHAAASSLRGLVLLNAHRFDDARQQAERILAGNPRDRIALGTLSDALLELGRFDDAVEVAQRSVDVKPDSSGYARAAYFRWLTGDTEGAKQFIKSALAGRDASDPEPAAWTFVEAAKIFWHQGDYDGADAVLAEALRWVADYPPALVARGRVALSREQADRAILDLEKALRAQPLPETAWLLGDARAQRGDTAGAEAAYQRAVQLGRRGDRLTLASFLATKNRDVDQAVRLIEDERRGRGGVYVDDVYAWTLYRAGRLDDARRAADAAIRLGTPDARLLYHAGAIQLATGTPAGRALIEKALALNPRFDLTGAAEARALLAATPAATAPAARRRDS